MDKVIIAYNKGYRCTSDGLLISKSGEEIGFANTAGYHNFSMRHDGKLLKVKTHRLQAFQKYGHKMFEDGIVVRHLNGDKLNFTWKNILIGTESENMMDVPKDVRYSRALHAASFQKKYDNAAVLEFYNECKSYKKTMKRFGISSKGTLNYIIKNGRN